MTTTTTTITNNNINIDNNNDDDDDDMEAFGNNETDIHDSDAGAINSYFVSPARAMSPPAPPGNIRGNTPSLLQAELERQSTLVLEINTVSNSKEEKAKKKAQSSQYSEMMDRQRKKSVIKAAPTLKEGGVWPPPDIRMRKDIQLLTRKTNADSMQCISYGTINKLQAGNVVVLNNSNSNNSKIDEKEKEKREGNFFKAKQQQQQQQQKATLVRQAADAAEATIEIENDEISIVNGVGETMPSLDSYTFGDPIGGFGGGEGEGVLNGAYTASTLTSHPTTAGTLGGFGFSRGGLGTADAICNTNNFGNTDAFELQRSIELGAAYNFKLQAQQSVGRGAGVKGAKGLRKILREHEVPMKSAKQPPKNVYDKAHLIKFRAGVDGRSNVQSYLQDKNDRQLSMVEMRKVENYSLYQQQQASYMEDNYDDNGAGASFSRAEEDNLSITMSNSNNMSNNMNVNSAAPSVPDVYIRKTSANSPVRDRDIYTASRDKNRGSPTLSTTGEQIRSPQTDSAFANNGDNLGLSPEAAGGAGAGTGEEVEGGGGEGIVLCDHEMCREKYGKVLEACFWSQSSNKTYCLHCWGKISSHLPHGVVQRGGGEVVVGEVARKAKEEKEKEESVRAMEKIELEERMQRQLFLNAKPEFHIGTKLLDKLNEKYVMRAFEGGGEGEGEEETKFEFEGLGGGGGGRGRTGYREVEGIPIGASEIFIEEKNRFASAGLVKNGVNVHVFKGRNFMNDGGLQPPTFHPSAKVKISYMTPETNSGVKGAKQKYSSMMFNPQEATRRRNIGIRKAEKTKRMAEKNGEGGVGGGVGGGKRGSKVKSASGRGKKPLVLECMSMSATGLSAGGNGYAQPDFAVPMRGIRKDVKLADMDGEGVVVDHTVKQMGVSKEKIVKIVHGVPVVFRDQASSMSAAELRAMKNCRGGTGNGSKGLESA